jgi:hypothetical protein
MVARPHRIIPKPLLQMRVPPAFFLSGYAHRCVLFYRYNPAMHMVVPILFSLFFYTCGWLFIFKTNAMVSYGRANYAKSASAKRRFVKIIESRWYPTYIRCAGAFIWLWALGFDCLFLFKLAKGN